MIEIREIQETEYSQLMQIDNEIWNYDNSPVVHQYDDLEKFQEKMSKVEIFVAVENGKILGFLNVPEIKFESHRFSMLIGIGVAKNAQGKGVGGQLLDWIKEYARKIEKRKICLRVLSTNTRAIDFYLKNGFVQEGVLKDELFINGKFVDDIFMAYFL